MRRAGVLASSRLHDVFLAQHAGFVLQHQARALVAIGEHRAVKHEFLAGLERQLQRHREYLVAGLPKAETTSGLVKNCLVSGAIFTAD